MKARIQFKTDSTNNWENNNFPLEIIPGELCIYSDYEETNRVNHLNNKIYASNIKIKVENKELNSLPFIFGNTAIENSQIEALFENKTTSALDELILDFAILA